MSYTILKEAGAIVSVCKEDQHRRALITFTSHGEVADREFSSVDKKSSQTIPSKRRISSLRRNHSQGVSKYSLARRTISCHRILMNTGLAGLSNSDS